MSADEDLDRAILEAHGERDHVRLATLYRQAALHAEARGDVDQACFFFVQAYVYALETGEDELARDVRQKLVAHGREE